MTALVLVASFVALLQMESNSDAPQNLGWEVAAAIHDPYLIVLNPPTFTITNTTCDIPPGTGEEGPAGVRAVYKIYKYKQSTMIGHEDNKRTNGTKIKRRIRLLCMVYTHSNRHDVVRAIAETYGKDCDGFWAASNLTDPTIGASHLVHDGPEAYQNMWNKVQKMWIYVYNHYLFEFDWFFICGDDTYVIPDNLRTVAAYYEANVKQRQNILKNKSTTGRSTPPLYLGASIPHSKNPMRRYCGGGAGYMLNRKAVLLLNRRIQSGDCPDGPAPDEDIRVARCLDDAGVKCLDTNDAAEQVRFHHLDAQFHASWTPTRSSLWLWPKLQYFHNIRGNQSKLDQISNTSTTFHLDKSKVRSRERDRGIRRYHVILNLDLCGIGFASLVKKEATCDAEQQAELRRRWMAVDTAYHTGTS